MPTARTTATAAADAPVDDALTPAERELYESLRNRAERAVAGTPARDVTAAERVLGSLLRDRDHLDGCPAINAADVAIARTEAYGDTRPAEPSKGLGPRPVVIVRCVECGGTKYHDGIVRPDDLILSTLEARRGGLVAGDDELDSTL